MIYLDNNATTLLDPEVYAAIQPFMQGIVGNPSSIHKYGQQAKGLLTESYKRCARFFDVRTDEIIYTSGATEGLNFLIRSLSAGSHVITSSLEHAAIIESLKLSGGTITFLDPEPGKGAISPAQIRKAIEKNTRMIVLSAANNETGIKIEMEVIAQLALEADIPFILDGVSLLGKE